MASLALAPLPGTHPGHQRGRGLEFLELRPYQSGDDVRRIHWRRTAAHGEPCTKLFATERERRLQLLVDLGPQMAFGTRGVFKNVAAARIAALLGWAAARRGDRLAAHIWQGSQWQIRPWSPARGAMSELIALLSRPMTPGPTALASLTASFAEIATTARSDDDLELISDFRCLDTASEQPLCLLAQRLTSRWWLVYDPFESDPPAGVFMLSDGVAERTLDYRSPAAREAQRRAFQRHVDRITVLARRAGAELRLLSTAEAAKLPERGLT
jgi:uncharacterized protein (DUF58 family)